MPALSTSRRRRARAWALAVSLAGIAEAALATTPSLPFDAEDDADLVVCGVYGVHGSAFEPGLTVERVLKGSWPLALLPVPATVRCPSCLRSVPRRALDSGDRAVAAVAGGGASVLLLGFEPVASCGGLPAERYLRLRAAMAEPTPDALLALLPERAADLDEATRVALWKHKRPPAHAEPAILRWLAQASAGRVVELGVDPAATTVAELAGWLQLPGSAPAVLAQLPAAGPRLRAALLAVAEALVAAVPGSPEASAVRAARSAEPASP